MSKRFQFKKEETKRALKVFAWSGGSVVVVLLLSLVSALDVPAEYLWAVPLVNTTLYALKDFIAEQL